MTWEQYRHLQAEARQRIAARLERLRPIAGDGVTLSGSAISLEPQAAIRPFQPRPLPWSPFGKRQIRQTVWVFVKVSWSVQGVDGMGVPFQSQGEDPDFNLAAICYPDTRIETIPSAWREAYHYDIKPFIDVYPFPWAKRTIQIRFAVRVFRRHQPITLHSGRFPFPVALGLWQVNRGPPAGVQKVDHLTVPRAGATYSPVLRDTSYEAADIELGWIRHP